VSDVLVVIPARLDSTRLPRKAVADVAGLPLVERVRRAAVEAGVGPVIVATDSAEIAAVITAFGGEVALTGPAANGTLRVAEVARGRTEPVVLNVQGDQPLLDPDHVRLVASLVRGESGPTIATLAARWPDDVDPADHHHVKVRVTDDGLAADFSRDPLGAPHRLHLGIYAFTRAALDRVTALAIGDRARAEGLEQLTWLEAGLPIRVGRVGLTAPAVDTAEQLADVRRRLGG
jgi:CMP-2-keto-3-deoxyoctulosonic acid synthetase